MTKGIYLNVSRKNDDLPQLIEESSEKFNLSKADDNFNQLDDWETVIFIKQVTIDRFL